MHNSNINGRKCVILDNPYKDCYSDFDLLALAKGGSKSAENEIIQRYRKFAVCCSGFYYMPGGDSDDVIQEALIGLMEAVRRFNPDKNVPFRSFAAVCISRRIISAVRAAARIKHNPLNSYVSLSCPDTGCDVSLLISQAYSSQNSFDPAEIVINRESLDGIGCKIDEALSSLEKKVLICFLEKMSYREIALKIGSDEKAVDNALSRTRRKLSAVFGKRV